MRRTLVVIFTLIFIGGLVREVNAKPTAKEYLKRGDAQLSRNSIARAIFNYTKAIELNPAFAEACVRRGMAQRAKGSKRSNSGF
jgi:hypothetical protein